MSKKEEKDQKKEEDWMSKKWRPMMAMMYMTCCFFDFVVFPIMFTIVQFWEKEAANDAFRQWQPLTLTGAGLFHMAMGAVLGITAYGRTQEKLGGAAAGNGITPPPSAPAIGSSPIGGSPISSAPIGGGIGGDIGGDIGGGIGNPIASAPLDTSSTTPAVRRPVVRPQI